MSGKRNGKVTLSRELENSLGGRFLRGNPSWLLTSVSLLGAVASLVTLFFTFAPDSYASIPLVADAYSKNSPVPPFRVKDVDPEGEAEQYIVIIVRVVRDRVDTPEDLRIAADCIMQMLERATDNQRRARLHLLLAQLSLIQADYRLAITNIEQARELDPHDYWASKLATIAYQGEILQIINSDDSGEHQEYLKELGAKLESATDVCNQIESNVTARAEILTPETRLTSPQKRTVEQLILATAELGRGAGIHLGDVARIPMRTATDFMPADLVASVPHLYLAAGVADLIDHDAQDCTSPVTWSINGVTSTGSCSGGHPIPAGAVVPCTDVNPDAPPDPRGSDGTIIRIPCDAILGLVRPTVLGFEGGTLLAGGATRHVAAPSDLAYQGDLASTSAAVVNVHATSDGIAFGTAVYERDVGGNGACDGTRQISLDLIPCGVMTSIRASLAVQMAGEVPDLGPGARAADCDDGLLLATLGSDCAFNDSAGTTACGTTLSLAGDPRRGGGTNGELDIGENVTITVLVIVDGANAADDTSVPVLPRLVADTECMVGVTWEGTGCDRDAGIGLMIHTSILAEILESAYRPPAVGGPGAALKANRTDRPTLLPVLGLDVRAGGI